MKTRLLPAALLACVSTFAITTAAFAQNQAQPWMDKSKTPEERAAAVVAAMTPEEKLSLVTGYTDPDGLAKLPDDVTSAAIKADVKKNHIEGAAGYVSGIPRLGIPPQWQTDASIGVRVEGMNRTALPSSLATAASFDPSVPYAGGVMIAHEARASGFNTFLAGGANLAREPRNGRNFEYVGEDPWLAGQMAGGLIQGIQSTHMVSTMKHYAVNDQESERTTVDVTISPEAMHQSDLLAFEFVYEKGMPGSVMCAYNLINGRWACENEYLQKKVLEHDWGFQGYIMSDWGAVHSTVDSVNYGLDMLTGFACCGDKQPWLNEANMKAALGSGDITQKRVDDMAYRIMWPLFAKGVIDDPVKVGPINFKANADVSQNAAEQSLTLLKNEGALLPLNVKSITLIGSHADKGVMAGGGSSGVHPVGGNQDALVDAVVAANPKTIVVVESGGAILMPWLNKVPAVLEAWYPGIRGGAAIARVLSGKVNPSGHLPISFPASNDQLAHAAIPGMGQPDGVPVHITYDEGAAIGYKWYDVKSFKPMFAFGHGLSYTTFAVSNGAATAADDMIAVTGTIANTGAIQGKGVAMAFVAPADYQAAGWEAPKRLVGFTKADLKAGANQNFSLNVDPRLLATFEVADNSWHIKAGTYHILLGQAADDLPVSVDVTLTDKVWSAVHAAK